jgi:predicted subunit of tRNA(5-methylaminomethyl-2-thiouridylate) methyltransferase
MFQKQHKFSWATCDVLNTKWNVNVLEPLEVVGKSRLKRYNEVSSAIEIHKRKETSSSDRSSNIKYLFERE